MGSLERIQRGSNWVIGKYVVVAYRSWEGPERLGEKARYTRNVRLFPRDQRRLALHPKHPTGFCPETGKSVACVSPSCSYYKELCRYGRFRWRPRTS